MALVGGFPSVPHWACRIGPLSGLLGLQELRAQGVGVLALVFDGLGIWSLGSLFPSLRFSGFLRLRTVPRNSQS